jgi:hypothetical protein
MKQFSNAHYYEKNWCRKQIALSNTCEIKLPFSSAFYRLNDRATLLDFEI